MTEAELSCSFCDKKKNEVQVLVARENRVYICDGCTEAVARIVLEERLKKMRARGEPYLKIVSS